VNVASWEQEEREGGGEKKKEKGKKRKGGLDGAVFSGKTPTSRQGGEKEWGSPHYEKKRRGGGMEDSVRD